MFYFLIDWHGFSFYAKRHDQPGHGRTSPVLREDLLSYSHVLPSSVYRACLSGGSNRLDQRCVRRVLCRELQPSAPFPLSHSSNNHDHGRRDSQIVEFEAFSSLPLVNSGLCCAFRSANQRIEFLKANEAIHAFI